MICNNKCNKQIFEPESKFYLPIYNEKGININFSNNVKNRIIICNICHKTVKEVIEFNQIRRIEL